MNSANVFVGAHCPHCNITIGLAASVGSPIKCPNCGRDMVAAKGSPETHVIANVTCKKCGTKIGMMSVVGGPAKCPTCGEPF
jgi:predicted Zn-ribbon and HTH transcriptional regulator